MDELAFVAGVEDDEKIRLMISNKLQVIVVVGVIGLLGRCDTSSTEQSLSPKQWELKIDSTSKSCMFP